jgi:hypothetical protein
VHCEPVRNLEAHEEYCRKEEAKGGVVHEFRREGWTWAGQKGGQGRRTDLEAVAKACETGDVEGVAKAHPVEFMKYPGGISKLCDHLGPRPEWREVECTILNGETGTGKSHYPACIYGEKNVYRLTRSMFESG